MIDVVIIGGGINGLVAAATLARQKLAVLVLDQHDRVGGAAVTNTSTRGFSAPRLSHSLGPLAPDVVRALHSGNSALARAKLKFLLPDPVLTTLGHNGECVTFHRDDILTAASINRAAKSPGGFLKTEPQFLVPRG